MALQFCVVCGRPSTRSSWNNNFGVFVACDFHSIAQITSVVSPIDDPGLVTPAPYVDNTDPSFQESSQT